MAKRITWILIPIISAIFLAFVISWIVPDRGNAKQVGETLHWHHNGDTVKLDIKRLEGE